MRTEEIKAERIIGRALQQFELDLTGLNVFTELGSNDYLYTPLIAARAGAESVTAITRDSRYGTAAELEEHLSNLRRRWGAPDVIEVVREKRPEALAAADIVTNSGFVRPIDRRTIDALKPTAVVPLMWETWEWRPDELDLEYARERGILVLGTHEEFLYGNNGFLVSKLLFELGLGVYKDRILVISSGRIGRSISDFFAATGVVHERVVLDGNYTDEESRHVASIDEVREELGRYDAVVVAEHHHDTEIIGEHGLLDPRQVREANPLVKLVHVCGRVSDRDVKSAGLEFHPGPPAPFGHMTVGAGYLDSHAVLELNTAGLRVGEIMARNRRRFGVERAYEESIRDPLVDDFPDGFWRG